MSKLNRLVKFLDLLEEFRAVERVMYIRGKGRSENDVEHSYQLAMTTWYLIDSENLALNRELALKYALCHDLVEAYAGDVWFYHQTPAVIKQKQEKEQKAQLKLKEKYSEHKELHVHIAAYERQEDPESRFVYALDKILPAINIYLDGGRIWKEKGITLKMLLEGKRDKIAVSHEILPYFEELVELLQKRADLFSKK